MKKNFAKKMLLNKVTVSRLNDNDMSLIRGATLIYHCTESCSLIYVCCDPKTIPVEKNKVQEKGL